MRLIDAEPIEKSGRCYMIEDYNGKEHPYISLERIRDAPTIDAVPVVRGKWIATDLYMTDECSCCGVLIDWQDLPEWFTNLSHYADTCPHCGADMREDDENG